jgi:hypothetical protein
MANFHEFPTDSITQCAAQNSNPDVYAELIKTQKELEQTRVQLAGCGAAALGYDEGEEGDYGWSASLGAVMDLRRKYEYLMEEKLTDKEILEEYVLSGGSKVTSLPVSVDKNKDITEVKYPWHKIQNELTKIAISDIPRLNDKTSFSVSTNKDGSIITLSQLLYRENQ